MIGYIAATALGRSYVLLLVWVASIEVASLRRLQLRAELHDSDLMTSMGFDSRNQRPGTAPSAIQDFTTQL